MSGPGAKRPTTTAVIDPECVPDELNASPQAPGGKHPVAIVICHGMGQQVPFETLECVAEALRHDPGKPKVEVRTEVVRLPQLPLATGKKVDPVDLRRAEIDVPVEPQRSVRVHLYEAYWAPITEGRVKLRDVSSFLFLAGMRGITQWRHFDRWMFGQWNEFPVPLRTPAKLLAIVALLLALAAINGVLGAVVGARLLGGAARWPGPTLFLALTSSVAIATFGVVLVALGIKVPALLRFLGTRASSYLAWLLIHLGLAAVVVAGASVVWDLALDQFRGVGSTGWLGPWIGSLHGLPYIATIALLWGLPFGLAIVVRWFLVQYVGDVVAYISAHSVSRFQEIRSAIQAVALKAGSAVYRAAARDGSPLYSHVIVVGHSLGSVVAYDMLNALINEDKLDAESARVRERTAMLLTFGSPLNKTAYLFRIQRTAGSEVRETMAAAVQPLIASAENRTMPWINIYSRNDWIGGPLQFYDTNPPDERIQVVNREDEDARTPLAAHNEHWENPMLAEVLKGAIARAQAGPKAADTMAASA